MSKGKKDKRRRQEEVATRSIQPSYAARRRVLLSLLSLFGLVLIGYAVDQQIFKGDFLRQEGRARYLRVVETPASRGLIVDRHRAPLAVSTPVDSVWANPRRLSPSDRKLTPLAQVLEMDADQLRQLLAARGDREFVYLRRRVNPRQAEAVSALNLASVGLQREYRRFYPSGEVSAHVVGFTGIDDAGQEGMELAYQDWLQADPGSKRVLQDGQARVVKDVESISASRPGRDMVLSLDRRLQYLAYRELKLAVKKHRARSGSAVILDAKTGEVLAMVNRPSYNPNGIRSARGGRIRNRTVTDVFEPGSTIKPFTVAAALELGRYRANTVINTTPGTLRVGRNLVRDIRNYGVIDVASVIRKSSNVGVSRIALSLSGEQLWQVFTHFGFGANTETGFPGEVTGQLPFHTGWSRFEQATLGFGYGLSVTPLQLARAYAVLAGDGLRRPVSLLRLDRAPAGAPVISTKTARTVRDMLQSVVSSEGTAPLAAVPGYRVAGKTGTVKKSIAGGYAKDKYLSLFAGMAPASDPRLVMVVVINEPQGDQYYGGAVAAPVFSKVMAGALRLLNIPPDAYGPQGLRMAAVEGTP